MPPQISLFVPCFVDQLLPQIAADMVTVLQRLGYGIHFPQNQTCCGQPAFNAGFWDEARPVAERFVQVFAGAETVVCPSGSCTAMVRSFFPELLASSPLREEAAALALRVFEFSEFLVDVAGASDVGACFPHKVTYHDSCHLLRELHIRRQPRELLRHVRGLELLELDSAEECCGFGGVFSVKFPEISGAMGDVKCGHIKATGAEFVTACDPSCLLHLEGVLRRQGARARTLHLASILASTGTAAMPRMDNSGARL
jgi:L-lactate dehydrogenase complex protein LldE